MNSKTAMSTEEWLRRDVMNPKSDQNYSGLKPRSVEQPMSTEDFLRNDVFAQRGADDIRDITPSSVEKFQQKDFMTRAGHVFGRMELHRNQEGQIVRRVTVFESKATATEYSYDEKGRLKSVVQNGAETERYMYGTRGERLQEINGTRYVYNHSSQLEQLITPTGQMYFLYDEKGNLVEKRSNSGPTRYSYTTSNSLKEVCIPDGRCIQYVYDPLGRRAMKLVNGTIAEKYSWKDALRLEAACTGEDSEHVVFKYSEEDRDELQPTSLVSNGKEYFLAYDQVGTLLAIADESGRVLHVEETDSFGRRVSRHTLAHVAMLSFGGGQLDPDTGLVHFLFRDYDPATGRFIQQDPLGLRGGDIDVYGYCLDDPVNLVDPIGLFGMTKEERAYLRGEVWDLGEDLLQLGQLQIALPNYGSVVAGGTEKVVRTFRSKDAGKSGIDAAPEPYGYDKGTDNY